MNGFSLIHGRASVILHVDGARRAGTAIALFGLAGLLGLSAFAASLSAQAPVRVAPASSPTNGAEPEGEEAGEPGARKKEEGIRLKDIARLEGVRSNQLLGYGLVVGLPGTGDTRSKLALRSLQNLLGNLGQTQSPPSLELKNVAAVLVTAEIPPFARKGDRISVVVSSIGDAKSLDGGMLVQTPLVGGNNETYAVAQGPLMAGGESRAGDAGKNVAMVPGGALIEKDLKEANLADRKFRVQLRDFDFTTLTRVVEAIDGIKKDTPGLVAAIEGGSVLVTLPEKVEAVPVLARIESLRIQPSYRARVVINQKTGSVVFGGDVRIDPVAVTRGPGSKDLKMKRQEAYQGIYVRSPGAAKEGEVVSQLQAGSVAELVDALNRLGVSSREIISILESLRDSGALHAEVVVL